MVSRNKNEEKSRLILLFFLPQTVCLRYLCLHVLSKDLRPVVMRLKDRLKCRPEDQSACSKSLYAFLSVGVSFINFAAYSATFFLSSHYLPYNLLSRPFSKVQGYDQMTGGIKEPYPVVARRYFHVRFF